MANLPWGIGHVNKKKNTENPGKKCRVVVTSIFGYNGINVLHSNKEFFTCLISRWLEDNCYCSFILHQRNSFV